MSDSQAHLGLDLFQEQRSRFSSLKNRDLLILTLPKWGPTRWQPENVVQPYVEINQLRRCWKFRRLRRTCSKFSISVGQIKSDEGILTKVFVSNFSITYAGFFRMLLCPICIARLSVQALNFDSILKSKIFACSRKFQKFKMSRQNIFKNFLSRIRMQWLHFICSRRIRFHWRFTLSEKFYISFRMPSLFGNSWHQ